MAMGSFCIVGAHNGDLGVELSGGLGGSTGIVGGLGVGPQFSTGQSLKDLAGPFADVGASTRFGYGGGVDVFTGLGVCLSCGKIARERW